MVNTSMFFITFVFCGKTKSY